MSECLCEYEYEYGVHSESVCMEMEISRRIPRDGEACQWMENFACVRFKFELTFVRLAKMTGFLNPAGL